MAFVVKPPDDDDHKWYEFKTEISLPANLRVMIPNDFAFGNILLHHFEGHTEDLVKASRALLLYVETHNSATPELLRVIHDLEEALKPYKHL